MTWLTCVVSLLMAAVVPGSASPGPQGPLGKVRKIDSGLLEFELPSGRVLRTHGLDPKLSDEPEGVAFTEERPPVCADEYTQHILYGYQTLLPNRIDVVREEIRSAVRRMNALLNQEALGSGNVEADFKVMCDAQGEIKVDTFSSLGIDYYSIFTAVEAAGYNDPKTKYSIFFDSDGGAFCGLGTYWDDDRPGQENSNNQGGDYALTYEPCWRGRTPMHENGHNMGAVQVEAPYSTGSGAHCYDKDDVMCYSPDGGDKNQTGSIWRCTDRMHYDCEHDTYFDAEPEDGEWLQNHWNIGSRVNRFISWGGGTPPPPPPPPPPSGNQAPLATFGRACVMGECRFNSWAYDPDGEINSIVWDFDDGTRSGRRAPSKVFATAGEHVVTMTATDDLFATTTVTKTVTTLAADPDPGATWVWPSQYEYRPSPPVNGWVYFKVWVPPGAIDLEVVVDSYCGWDCLGDVAGVECPASCGSDLGLFVKQGARPSEQSADCSSDRSASVLDHLYYGSDYERCSISAPSGGLWFIGIRQGNNSAREFYFNVSYDDREGRDYYYCGQFETGLLPALGPKAC